MCPTRRRVRSTGAPTRSALLSTEHASGLTTPTSADLSPRSRNVHRTTECVKYMHTVARAVAARQHLASASPDGSEMTGNATMCAQVDRVCGASHGERSPMQPNI
jgi:hypothetical protein